MVIFHCYVSSPEGNCYEPIKNKKNTSDQLKAIDVIQEPVRSSWTNDATRLLTFAILEDRPFKALEKSVEELPEYGNNGAPVHQRSCFRTRIIAGFIYWWWLYSTFGQMDDKHLSA